MTQFIDGNRIELLHNGVEYFPALVAAFDAAIFEIHMQTYMFFDDRSGRAVADALKRAAARGISVHLLIDGFGSKRLRPEFLRSLKDSGVKILKYRPQIAIWDFRRTHLRRLHHKIAVVDAKRAFVGGINIIDDLDELGGTSPRFDYAVKVEGPLVVQIHAAAARLWNIVAWLQLKPRKLTLPKPSPTTPHQSGTQRAAFCIRSNVRHRFDIENAYLGAMRKARSEILIANAYFFPGIRFRQALMEAAARGVRTILLLQGRVEYRLLHYASRALYRRFLDANIEIYEYHHSFMHAKVAVIDGRWATVGSSNIDPLSLLLAREANVIIEDEGFARELRDSLEIAIATGAQPVVSQVWRRQRWIARATAWLCYEIVRVLTGWSSYGRARDFT